MLLEESVDKKNDLVLSTISKLNSDPRHDILNLCLGYYIGTKNNRAIFSVVDKVETDKYLAPSLSVLGSNSYRSSVSTLLDPECRNPNTTVQTLGATGALSLALNILKSNSRCSKVWISNPSWSNHYDIVKYQGLSSSSYSYKTDKFGCIDINAALSDLEHVSRNDAIIIQGCCHNPTGIDFSLEQLRQLSELANRKKATIIVDFAYFGLLGGVDKDRDIIDILSTNLSSYYVAISFSKNLGLYGERIGALSFFSDNDRELGSFSSIAKTIIRANYSMGPQIFSSKVSSIIDTATLRELWVSELSEMRSVLKERRCALVSTFKDNGLENILINPSGNGMFISFALELSQINILADQYGIYILPNGRLSIASLHLEHIPRLTKAIKSIVNNSEF